MHRGRTAEEVEWAPERFLDRHAPLEQTGCHVEGVRLELTQVGNRDGERQRLASALGVGERRACVRSAGAGAAVHERDLGPEAEDPRRPGVVTRGLAEGVVQ